jgi:hypothetical protein
MEDWRVRACIIAFFVFLLTSEARAEILRCSATGLSYGSEVKVDVSIALPPGERNDRVLTLATKDRGEFVELVGGISPKRQGFIEIKVTSPYFPYWAEKGHYDLVVTSPPGNRSSLAAFYLIEEHFDALPVIVKADVWHESKRFTMAASSSGPGIDLLVGQCQ